MKRLGILLSGRGSNFLAIHRAIGEGRLTGAEIAVVLSNKADAPGLAAARALGLPAAVVEAKKTAERDAALIALLQDALVDLVCLAGYMRIISAAICGGVPAADFERASQPAAGVSWARRTTAGAGGGSKGGRL